MTMQQGLWLGRLGSGNTCHGDGSQQPPPSTPAPPSLACSHPTMTPINQTDTFSRFLVVHFRTPCSHRRRLPERQQPAGRRGRVQRQRQRSPSHAAVSHHRPGAGSDPPAPAGIFLFCFFVFVKETETRMFFTLSSLCDLDDSYVKSCRGNSPKCVVMCTAPNVVAHMYQNVHVHEDGGQRQRG